MSHLRYQMIAGIEPFLPAKKPPTTPKPSTPIAKPIPKKQPAPKGDNSDDQMDFALAAIIGGD